MSDLRLYLVKADRTHIDDFDAAVVWAFSPDDAVAITLATIRQHDVAASGGGPPVAGVWESLYDGATLTATEVPAVRGPVLGHATPC